MVLGDVEETVTTQEMDEETQEEIIKVPSPPLQHPPGRPRIVPQLPQNALAR